MFGLLKGAARTGLLGAIFTAGALSAGYYKVAEMKLPRPDGAVVTAGVCRPQGSLSGATLPVTFEAFLKDAKGHNFVSSGGKAGLVIARYEWSHGGFAWIEDAGFAERQAAEVAARRKLARRGMGDLVKDLRSADAEVREVSAKELLLRTSQTFGYAYDLPQAERDKAAEAWERWWADDRNRMRYGAQRAIETVSEMLGAADGDRALLERFRKALGVEAPR